jgi:hypothetical protein
VKHRFWAFFQEGNPQVSGASKTDHGTKPYTMWLTGRNYNQYLGFKQDGSQEHTNLLAESDVHVQT